MFSRVNGFHSSELLELAEKLLSFRLLEERKEEKKKNRLVPLVSAENVNVIVGRDYQSGLGRFPDVH